MQELPPLDNSNINTTIAEIVSPFARNFTTGPSSKEIMIGVGTLVVLAIVFLLIRNAFVNYLVANLKRSPNSAGLAGWGLFGALLFGSAIGCIAIVSRSFLVLPFIAPLASLSIVCLIICITSSFKK